ncbi:MAG: hypothetical protein J6Y65_00645, partial [Eggerthellaceae bacterium]|nr:hypothetical protein [Eggerthellaceae bacterium]
SHSKIRSIYYEYAYNRIAAAVNELRIGNDSIVFPHLPISAYEVQETSLYTEQRYPVSFGGQNFTIHLFEDCPYIDSILWYGSLEDMSYENEIVCSFCNFSLDSLGDVALATGRIETGYEYHFNRLADIANRYYPKKRETAIIEQDIKTFVDDIFETCADFFSEIGNARISIDPPGKRGAVVLVIDTASGLANARGGVSVALSAATLVESPESSSKANIIELADPLMFSELEDKISVLGVAFDIWRTMLEVYTDGFNAVERVIGSAFGFLGNLFGASSLGSWAKSQFRTLMEKSGFSPVPLHVVKPLLINSTYLINAPETGVTEDDEEAYAFFAQLLTLVSWADKEVSTDIWR